VSGVEIIFVLAGIGGLVLVIIFAGRILEARNAKKLASPLVGRSCLSCGTSFSPDVIRSARLETPFDGPSYPSVVCPSCSKRWALIEGNLVEHPV
jgi:hypothetical protein